MERRFFLLPRTTMLSGFDAAKRFRKPAIGSDLSAKLLASPEAPQDHS
jgi:hypothetical protein